MCSLGLNFPQYKLLEKIGSVFTEYSGISRTVVMTINDSNISFHAYYENSKKKDSSSKLGILKCTIPRTFFLNINEASKVVATGIFILRDIFIKLKSPKKGEHNNPTIIELNIDNGTIESIKMTYLTGFEKVIERYNEISVYSFPDLFEEGEETIDVNIGIISDCLLTIHLKDIFGNKKEKLVHLILDESKFFLQYDQTKIVLKEGIVAAGCFDVKVDSTVLYETWLKISKYFSKFSCEFKFNREDPSGVPVYIIFKDNTFMNINFETYLLVSNK